MEISNNHVKFFLPDPTMKTTDNNLTELWIF